MEVNNTITASKDCNVSVNFHQNIQVHALVIYRQFHACMYVYKINDVCTSKFDTFPSPNKKFN